MKALLRILIPGLTFVVSFVTFALAQNRSFVAGTDTVDIYPYVPVVHNLLANDTIPAGDTIYRVVGGGSENVLIKIDSNKVFTFTGKKWGLPALDTGTYTILLTNGNHTSGTILFRIHDFSYDYLNINNVSAPFFAYGNHFYRENAEFEVPKGSGKTSIFSNAFWVGGKDGQGGLHFAGERYRQGPTSGIAGFYPDFYGGPVMDSAFYSIYQDTLWNYVWNLKRSDLEYHAAHYTDPGYHPIHDILTWPGNGNTAMGQAHKLAPFYDRNSDGLYDPMDGDAPEIRGDQELYFILNDDRGAHRETNGEKLRIEIHGMAYAFDMPDDTALKNTVFLHYQVFNRSQNTYDSTYFGVFTDIDLGYAYDDYVGCDVERSMYYGYNGDPVDGNGEPWAYGEHPPCQGVILLGGPRMDDDGIDNPKYDNLGNPLCDYSVNGVNFGDTVVDNERFGMVRFVYFANSGVPNFMTDPNYADQYYSLMKGLWKDGTPIIYGGNGHLTAGGYGPACRFMYPGESDSLNWGTECVPPNGAVNWTEITAGNSPFDKRGLGVSGPFTFGPGDGQEIDIAFAWARDYTATSRQGSLEKLRGVADKLNQIFITNKLPNGQPFFGTYETKAPEGFGVKIFPNPAGNRVVLDLASAKASGPVTVYLLNNQGQQILNLQVPANTKKGEIDVSGLPDGLYLVRILTSSGTITKKLVVVR